MVITLTHEQWENLVPLVAQGNRAEIMLGLPIDLDNGDQRINIKADEVKIQLEDE
jgi:hypothetical protein